MRKILVMSKSLTAPMEGPGFLSLGFKGCLMQEAYSVLAERPRSGLSYTGPTWVAP